MISGCIATQRIPSNTPTYTVGSFALYTIAMAPGASKYSVFINEFGFLQAKGNVPEYEWFRAITLADYAHSHNAILETTGYRQFRVRTTQTVLAGERLQIWFPEEILTLMNVPTLTTEMIGGELGVCVL